MSELSWPFDSGPGANTTEDQWRLNAKAIGAYTPGVLPDEGSELAVFADSTGMQVKLPDGAAGILGHVYENTSNPLVLPVDASGASDRWDRVLLVADFTANQITADVRTGSTDANGPSLTQNRTALFELPLAYVKVRAGTTTITAADVFLDLGRFARAVNASPPGSIVDTMLAAAPLGYVLCDGTAMDWHYVPALKAAGIPDYTGATRTYGLEASSGLVHFPDYRGRFSAMPDTGQGRLSGVGFAHGTLLAAAGGDDSPTLDPTMIPALTGDLHVPGRTGVPTTAESIVTVDGDPSDGIAVPELQFLFYLAGHVAGASLGSPWHVTARDLIIGSASPVPVPTVPPVVLANKMVKV